MKRFNILLLLGLWFLNIHNAHSCQCNNTNAQISFLDFQLNDVIFIGKCTNIKVVNNLRYFTFQIERNFKQKQNKGIIEIISSSSDSDCGLEIKKMQRWLIVGNYSCNGLYTNRCAKNKSSKEMKSDSLNLEIMSNLKDGNINKLSFINLNRFDGKILNGKPIGVWNFYDSNSKLYHRINYQNGVINLWITFIDSDPLDLIDYSPKKIVRYYSNGELYKILSTNKNKVIGDTHILKAKSSIKIIEKKYEYINKRWVTSITSQDKGKCLNKIYYGNNSKPIIL